MPRTPKQLVKQEVLIDLSNLSPEDQDKLRSKPWRINHLYKITNKEAKLVQFKRNRAQTHYSLNKDNRNILLKSRQLGFTTDACVDMLDDVLWKQNLNELLISYDDESALSLFDNKVSLAFEHYPFKQYYDIDADRANKLKIGFRDGQFSEIAVKSSGRSTTLQRVHISEFAKICAKYPLKAKEIVTGTFPAVPLSGRIDIESTAEGDKGKFHDMFWEAWLRERPKKPTEFKAHFYNWQWDDAALGSITAVDPDIPKEFREYQLKHNELALRFPSKYQIITDLQLTWYFYQWLSLERSWKQLKQEYPTTPEEAFISSGARMFDTAKIDELIRALENYPSPTEIGHWTIYEEPKPGHVYVIGADPAGGDGRHHAAAVVWDMTPFRPKVVATFKDDLIRPDAFAYELKSKAVLYNTALVAVENNNHGFTTLSTLKGIYPTDQIFKVVKQDKEDDVQTDKLGFNMNLATKPKIVYDMITAVHNDLVEIPSKALLAEARSYNRTDMQKIRDDEDDDTSKHADLLTSAMIGFATRDYLDEYAREAVVIRHITRTNIFNGV